MIDDLQSLCTVALRRHHSAAANDGAGANAPPVDGRAVHAFFDSLTMGRNPCLQFESVHALVVLFDRLTLEQQQEVRDDAVPVLFELLRSEDERARTKANAAVLEIACCDSEIRRNLVVGHLARGILGDDPAIQLRCTKHIHRILGLSNPPIQQVVEAGVVPRLVDFLQRADNPDLQHKAVRTLNIIAWAGAAHANVVVNARAIPAFVVLLSSPDKRVKAEAALGLGNLAVYDPIHRDLVLEEGTMSPLLALLSSEASKRRVLEAATRAVAILYSLESAGPVLRPADQQRLDNVVIPRLVDFLYRDGALELQAHAARALSSIMAGDPEHVNVGVDEGAIPAFAWLLRSSPDEGVQEAAAWGLANIAKDNPNFRDLVLQNGAMRTLLEVLRRRGSGLTVLREAIRALSMLYRWEPYPVLTLPEKQVLQDEVVPRLVDFLQRDDDQNLQFEAARALSYVADGNAEHTNAVVNAGAIPTFVRLFCSPDNAVKERAAWGLGNIAADNPDHRDLVLRERALTPLLDMLRHPGSNRTLLRTAAWAVSMLCIGEPRPQFELIRPALIAIPELLNRQDDEIVANACWALSYVTGGTDSKIQEVIDADLCPRVVELLRHSSPTVQEPVISTVANILKGSRLQTQVILEQKPLTSLLALLESATKRIKTLACWSIGAIVSIDPPRIQEVIECRSVPSLIALLTHSELSIRKNAALAIRNVTQQGTVDQIQVLVAEGCIPALCGVLTVHPSERKLVLYALASLERILSIGRELSRRNGGFRCPTVALISFSTAGLRSKLQKLLLQHPDGDVRHQAWVVLESVFRARADFERDAAAAVAGTSRDGGGGGGGGSEPPRKRPRRNL